jgi:hypothetical protein
LVCALTRTQAIARTIPTASAFNIRSDGIGCIELSDYRNPIPEALSSSRSSRASSPKTRFAYCNLLNRSMSSRTHSRTESSVRADRSAFKSTFRQKRSNLFFMQRIA